MKTIDERAKDAWSTYEYREGCLYHTTFEDGYTKGATEQKAIDIDKACEWFENWAEVPEWYTIGESIKMLRKAMGQKAIDDDHSREVKKMLIDKACEWLESHFRDIENPDFYSKRNHPTELESMYHWSVKELVDDFRKAMEEQI